MDKEQFEKEWKSTLSNSGNFIIQTDNMKKNLKKIKHIEKWPFHIHIVRNYYEDNDDELTFVGNYTIEENSESVLLRSIYINEDFRSKGYGRELFSDFMKEIINKYNNVYLIVKNDNEVAIKMYQKAGFVYEEEADQLHHYMKLELKKIKLK